MAHEHSRSHKETHRHKHKHQAEAENFSAHLKLSKHAKSSKAHKGNSDAGQRARREPAGVKKPSKSKKSVNIASIFKKSRHQEDRNHKHKNRNYTPKPDLSDKLRDGIEEARAAIDTNLKTSFDAVHAEFLQRLSESRARDKTFSESMSATASMLSAPLVEEQIEATFIRDGERVTEILEIGKRIELFKKSVEKDEAKLKGYWKQWEDLHSHFLELGVEVFGPEAFGELADEGEARHAGYREDMEMLDFTHNADVKKLTQEVEGITGQMLAKMKESEKQLDATAKEQQAKLLQALIAG